MTAVDERVCAPTLTSGRAGDEPYSSWVRRARCAGRSAVFSDDVSADEALAVCGGCAVRRQCRAWALTNAVDGVAGGMTAEERTRWRREARQPEPVVSVEEFLRPEVVSVDRTWGRGRSDAILNAVARWTEDGETAGQIGVRLGVTRRTVNRLRARCRERQAS
jgi:hypothetical protein